MTESSTHNKKKNKGLRILIWILGLFAVALISVQVILANGLITDLVNRYATTYINGELTFGNISVNIFKRFPKICVTLSDAAITYPADKFEEYEKNAGRMTFIRAGKGREIPVDTLASFKEFTTALSLKSLINGEVKFAETQLVQPRIFAKHYCDTVSNWNIIDIPESEDTSSTSLPPIVIEDIRLTKRPVIIYSSPADTLFATFNVKEIRLDGKLNLADPMRSICDFAVDSMAISGRTSTDTLMYGLSRFRLRKEAKLADIELKSMAFAFTTAGRVRIPLELSASASIPDGDISRIGIEKASANIAHIPLEVSGEVTTGDEGREIIGRIGIGSFNLTKLIDEYGHIVLGDLKLPDADAELSFSADVRGKGDRIDAELNEFAIKGSGINVSFTGDAKDLTGKDPRFSAKGEMDADIDSLVRFLPDSLGYIGKGKINGSFSGSLKMSDIKGGLAKIARTDISGKIEGNELALMSEKDSVNAYMGHLKINANSMTNKMNPVIPQGERMLGLIGSVDTVNINYKDSLDLVVRNLILHGTTAADILEDRERVEGELPPFNGNLKADLIEAVGIDTLLVRLSQTNNIFRIYTNPERPLIPMMSLNSINGGFYLKDKMDRIALRGLRFNADMEITTYERKARMNAFRDSLSRVYPDVHRDSLFFVMRRDRMKDMPKGTRPAAPVDEFKDADIKLDLGETLSRYYREWNFSGNLDIDKIRLITPKFPLNTTVEKFSGSFSNDMIGIGNVMFTAGTSSLNADGKVSGLRRAIGRQRRSSIINLDLNVRSDSLNFNELVGAYNKGVELMESIDDEASALSDEELADKFQTDTLTQAVIEGPLVVIPGNIDARLSIDGKKIRFNSIKIDSLKGKADVKDRCIRLAGVDATSNVGKIEFDGYFATRSRNDLKAGMSLALREITAERIIELLPSVDTLIPMLKSFKGNLDCELAATADLDTNMNFVMPSMNGVIRIKGRSLNVSADKELEAITKLLKFDDYRNISIDELSVEGLIADNRLEVFPFTLDVDQYRLALSGIHSLDMNYIYHASVLKSPLIFRFGIDLYGDDFENMKFRLCQAKYRSGEIPVFTSVVDDVQSRLTQSIDNIFHTGIDKAITESSASEAINSRKRQINYKAAVDQASKQLSEQEKSNMESISTMVEGVNEIIK